MIMILLMLLIQRMPCPCAAACEPNGARARCEGIYRDPSGLATIPIRYVGGCATCHVDNWFDVSIYPSLFLVPMQVWKSLLSLAVAATYCDLCVADMYII